MASRLIIDGNAVYEIDEECIYQKQKEENARRARKQGGKNIKDTKPGRR